jgi:hypothetical protein
MSDEEGYLGLFFTTLSLLGIGFWLVGNHMGMSLWESIGAASSLSLGFVLLAVLVTS